MIRDKLTHQLPAHEHSHLPEQVVKLFSELQPMTQGTIRAVREALEHKVLKPRYGAYSKAPRPLYGAVPKIVNGKRYIPRGQDWYDRPYDVLLKLNPKCCTLKYIGPVVRQLSGDRPEGMTEEAWSAEVKRRVKVVKAQIDAQALRLLVALQEHRRDVASQQLSSSTTPSTTSSSSTTGGAGAGFFARRAGTGTNFRGGSASGSSFSALMASSDDEADGAGAPIKTPVELAKDVLEGWHGLYAEGKHLWPDAPAQAGEGDGAEGGGAAPQPKQQLDILGTGAYLLGRCKEQLPDLITVYRFLASIPGSAAQIERDQGRCLDYATRKRSCIGAAMLEMCGIVDAHRRDEPIVIKNVKQRTKAHLEECKPMLVREPEAWRFRQADLGGFHVDFDLDEDEEEVPDPEEWEEEVDVEGAPLRPGSDGDEEEEEAGGGGGEDDSLLFGGEGMFEEVDWGGEENDAAEVVVVE